MFFMNSTSPNPNPNHNSNSNTTKNQTKSNNELILLLELDKKRIEELEKENLILKTIVNSLDTSSSSLNPFAEALIVYKDHSNVYLYGEKNQLQTIACKIPEQKFDLTMNYYDTNTWGPHLKFKSIASVYTILLRNGFVYSHESKAQNSNEYYYHIEVWCKK